MTDISKPDYHYAVVLDKGSKIDHRTAIDYTEDESTGTLTLTDWNDFKVASYAKGEWRRVEMVGEPSAE